MSDESPKETLKGAAREEAREEHVLEKTKHQTRTLQFECARRKQIKHSVDLPSQQGKPPLLYYNTLLKNTLGLDQSNYDPSQVEVVILDKKENFGVSVGKETCTIGLVNIFR